jgi:hypothetical protein
MLLFYLKVKTPVNVYSRRIKNYYLSEISYIPSQTVRGAILDAYINMHGNVKEDFYTSPAYPLNAAPAHALSPAKGRKEKEYIEKRGILQEIEKGIQQKIEEKAHDNLAQSSQNKFESGFKEFYNEYLTDLKNKIGPVETKDKEVRLKPKIGKIIEYKRTEGDVTIYGEFKNQSIINMHATISKYTGATEKGMLYAYEYKYFDTLWFLANQDLGITDIYIGKGREKGFGMSEIKIVKEIKFEEPKEGEWGYCLSQCLPSLREKQFFKPSIIIGETEIYTGWFTNSTISARKPTIRVLSPGTLIRIEKIIDLEALKPAGLNFILKIPDLHYLIKEVGNIG